MSFGVREEGGVGWAVFVHSAVNKACPTMGVCGK